MTLPLDEDAQRQIQELELKLAETMEMPFIWRSANEPHARHRRDLTNGLLAELAELAKRTDPAKGDSTANDKDYHALRALELAGQLVDQVAGWALDHVYGVSLLEEDASGVDDHSYEARGAELRSEDYYELSDPQARRLLRDLLRANPGGFPDWLTLQAVVALDGLAFGETYPLLEPLKKGRKVPHSSAMLQLKALEIVEYKVAAFGIKKYVAEEEVCDAYAVARDTLLSWKYRLATSLGWRLVTDHLQTAKAMADLSKETRKIKPESALIFDAEKDDEIIDAAEKDIESSYGDQALREYSNLYRRRADT